MSHRIEEDIVFMIRKGNQPKKVLEEVWDLLFAGSDV